MLVRILLIKEIYNMILFQLKVKSWDFCVEFLLNLNSYIYIGVTGYFGCMQGFQQQPCRVQKNNSPVEDHRHYNCLLLMLYSIFFHIFLGIIRNSKFCVLSHIQIMKDSSIMSMHKRHVIFLPLRKFPRKVKPFNFEE